MRRQLFGMSAAMLAVGALAALASPAAAKSVVTRPVTLQNTPVSFGVQQAAPGTVTLEERCSPVTGEPFTVRFAPTGTYPAQRPVTLRCDGQSHTITWHNVPAGLDRFTLRKTTASSSSLHLTVRIVLP